MKKVTRLLRPKSKKAKDAQYNALSGGNGNGGSAQYDGSGTESMPAVHNYSKSKNKVKVKTTKTQPTKVKLTNALTKNQTASSRTGDTAYATASIERASISSTTTDNNNFNYSSLNRKRNSYSNSSCGSIVTRDTTTPTTTAAGNASKQQLQKRRGYDRKRWWRRLLRFSLCAGARRKRAAPPHCRYKDYWHQPAKKQKRRRCCSCCSGLPKRVGGAKCWRWCCVPCCCCNRRIGSYPYDSEEDDDIDGKFAAYIYEMQQRDLAALPTASATDASPTVATTQLQSMPTKESTKQEHALTTATERVSELGSAPVVGACNVAPPPPTAFVYRRRSSNGGLLKLKPRAWTWDDSLRSNSDRFLETLEEDELNAPHVCSFVARRPPLLAPTAEVHRRGGIPTRVGMVRLPATHCTRSRSSTCNV